MLRSFSRILRLTRHLKTQESKPSFVPSLQLMGAKHSTMEFKSNEHFVLKSPIKGPYPEGMEVAYVATGCFWGAEKGFWRFPGVFSTSVGYTAGSTKDPTYEQVCTGSTGHAEGVQIVYDPTKVSFVDIVRQYLQCHDPTQGNRQGGDTGTQYRSGLYYVNEEQKAIAEAAFAAYETALGKKLTAELAPLGTWYYAEEYHQQYLAKPGNRQYCSAMPTGVSLPPADTWLSEPLLEKHAPKLPEAYWEKHAPSPHCVLREPHEPIQWP